VPTFAERGCHVVRLSPYVLKIIGDYQYGIQHKRPTTDNIFWICQILEEKWEYNETVHQLFIVLKQLHSWPLLEKGSAPWI
jgi:hypothetical protein